jgi:hypothetical protein
MNSNQLGSFVFWLALIVMALPAMVFASSDRGATEDGAQSNANKAAPDVSSGQKDSDKFSLPVNNSANAIAEGSEWTGSISNQKERFVKIVTTKNEWDALWKRALDKPAPNVNFDRFAVACVFLGHDADWLYSIGFGKPYVRGEIMVIPYSLGMIVLELMGPFKAGGQYKMRVYKKSRFVDIIIEESSSSGK